MKLALICEHFDPLRSAHDGFVVWLAHGLAGRGVEVHVVCHDAKGVNPYRAAHQGASHEAHLSARAHQYETAASEGIHIHRLAGIRLSNALGFRAFGRQAREWCGGNQVDVVQSFTLAYAGDLYFPLTGAMASLREALTSGEARLAASVWKRLLVRMPGKPRTLLGLERRVAEAESPWRIICPAPMVARAFAEHYAVSRERLVVVQPPLTEGLPDMRKAAADRAWFRSHYRLGAGDAVAIFVGHDFRRHGLRWAIEALARCQRPWHLLVVGLGRFREYLELAERLGLASRVKFIGPTQELGRLYPAADVLLLPTHLDTLGKSVGEALSFGLPVISTRQMGCCDLIEEHHLGAIVSRGEDVAGIAEALDGLPLGGPGRENLAWHARQVAAGLDAVFFLDDFVGLLEGCLKHKRVTAG